MKFKLVVAFVEPDLTDKVIKTAKNAGATGNVVLSGKGSGLEPASFMGLAISERTDAILMVVEEHSVNSIISALTEEINLEEPGNGVVVVLDINKVAGLSKQIKKIKEKLGNENL
jgi:nitrogen regulatory protein PII